MTSHNIVYNMNDRLTAAIFLGVETNRPNTRVVVGSDMTQYIEFSEEVFEMV